MGKIAVVFRFIISVILGFLPSFGFVFLFVRKGSVFTNYMNFLSNFQASKWAWISGIAIALIIFLIWNIAKSESSHKKSVLFFIFLFLIIGGAFFCIQAYMYIKFYLGGDTLVQLSVDKENIFFGNKTEESVSFRTQASINSLCSAECRYEFFDVTQGKMIDSGTFIINPVSSETRDYSLERENIISGQTLKRFKVICKSIKTNLCYSLEKENQKAVLITLNYGLTKEQNEIIESSKPEILSLEKDYYNVTVQLKESQSDFININKTIITDDLLYSFNHLSESSQELDFLSKNLKKSLENQDFSSFKKYFESSKTRFDIFKSEENKFNSEIISRLSIYNMLIENLTLSKTLLEETSQRNLTETSCNKLNGAISEFNTALANFKNKTNIDSKKTIVKDIYLKAKEITENSNNDIGNSCNLTEKLTNEKINKINFTILDRNIPTITFKQPSSACCYLGICKNCCDEKCSNRNYPIVFLHGHSISSNTPADYSFDSLLGIKEKLVSEKYIDGGTLVISSLEEEKGLLGKPDFPFMITTSYFFDLYKNQEGKFLSMSSKKDSIDTYALRLKDIIDIIKYKTNKDKVIIIAHSMGGVVIRRYIQIFGASNIDKLIFIDTPNHGTDSRITRFCGVLGSDVVCKDLDENSLFMNKLNNAPTEKPEIHNIIGIGCDMGVETGDGIVKNSSQYLDYATNYYVSGKCDELTLDYLHENIADPNQHLEVYEIIKKVLQENKNKTQ
ncbi:MAG: alpha/beta fold hydrolase [Nanoarchaeota archaeon]|mgnify:CR=1 FL=1